MQYLTLLANLSCQLPWSLSPTTDGQAHLTSHRTRSTSHQFWGPWTQNQHCVTRNYHLSEFYSSGTPSGCCEALPRFHDSASPPPPLLTRSGAPFIIFIYSSIKNYHISSHPGLIRTDRPCCGLQRVLRTARIYLPPTTRRPPTPPAPPWPPSAELLYNNKAQLPPYHQNPFLLHSRKSPPQLRLG